MKPIVAIVGRPNVGKSTLFNRLTESKDALVDNLPGVTRDRHYGLVDWGGVEFRLVDTGGFLPEDADEFSAQIFFQIQKSLTEADAVVAVLDGKTGISPFDQDMIDLLRKTEKPCFYVVNKLDNPQLEEPLADFYALGLEKLIPISAMHGFGINDLLDDIVEALPGQEVTDEPEDVIRIAVVGRPNVGKSSLVNRIVGENRLIVSATPGTTRDAIDTAFNYNGKDYLIVDTAGIRRKSKVSKRIEKFSVIKALKSMDRCDVALIVVDASEGITDQDISIAGYAYERGCGCIFLLNKWDIVEKDHKTGKRFFDDLRIKAKFLSFAPILTMSALTGKRVVKIFDLIDDVYRQYQYRIATSQLNRIFETAIMRTEPSLYQGKRLKFFYATQVAAKPPKFICFVNYPEGVHFSYRRYLVNQIREEAKLDKTPIKLFFRKRNS